MDKKIEEVTEITVKCFMNHQNLVYQFKTATKVKQNLTWELYNGRYKIQLEKKKDAVHK